MPDKIQPLSAFYDPSKIMSMTMMEGRLDNQQHGQALQEERMLQQQAKAGMEQRLAGIKEALPSMPNGPEKAQALTWALNAGAGPKDPRITVTTEALQADGNLLQTMLLAEDDESRTQAFGEYLKRNPKDLKTVQDAHNKQRALIGYGQFLEAAGLPNNDSTRAAVADSGPMQNQLGQAAMESPIEMARREELQAKTKAAQLKIAGMNVGAKVLVEGMAPVTPIIELGDKYLPKMEALTKAGESGLAYQGGKIARAGDPQFGAYLDGMKERRAQAFDDIGKIYEATGNLQRIKDLHTQANEPLPRGETMETINAKLQSYGMLKDLRDAEVQYYGNPNATTLKAVKEARDAANGQIQNWQGQKGTLDAERIEFTKNAQALQQEKFKTKQGYDSNVALGQAELLDVKAAGGNIDREAASIARKYKVKPSDITSALKEPNKPLVEVNMAGKASEEAAKDFTKSTRATYDQLKSAPILLRNIEEAKALVPQAKGFMGPGGETLLEAAKFLNGRLGAKINTEGIKSAEELRTRIFFNIMENLKKMDAQPSQLQQQIMQDSLGKLGTDPNALSHVLDAYGDTIRDKVELFNNEVAGAEKKGTQFPYDPRIILPERLSPTGEPIIRTESERDKLPSGTIYFDPDGKKRKKP